MNRKLISVDIVIPQYKNNYLLARALESMGNITFPDEITNVWVIENGGEFGAADVVESFKDKIPVKYSYLDEGNLSLARNRGVELSTADVLIFFDNDMTFYPYSLTRYIDNFKQYGDAYFYGGALEPDYQKMPEDWLVPFLPNSAKGFSLGENVVEHNKPDFLGGNHAVFRKHLIDIGGYDSGCAVGNNSGLVGEETRLQQKLLDKGIKGLYVPGARVKHYVPSQNCSKEWILQRARRHGLTMGISYPENGYKKLFGIPIYHFRIIIINLFRMIFELRNERRQFKSRYEVAFQMALIKQIGKGYIKDGTK
tara:strand:+ start:12812 stop:13741 length:930 start_codon:yes stop_codon:yes gene_type:complete